MEENSPENLNGDNPEKYKRLKRKIVKQYADRFTYIAEVNSTQLRRIWLRLQYDSFRTSMSFLEANNSILAYVKQSTNRHPDRLYNADVMQRLRKMSEFKQREFLELAQLPIFNGGSDMFTYSLEADIEDLLSDILGKKVSLESREWEIILSDNMFDIQELSIELPNEVSTELDRYIASYNIEF